MEVFVEFIKVFIYQLLSIHPSIQMESFSLLVSDLDMKVFLKFRFFLAKTLQTRVKVYRSRKAFSFERGKNIT